jgi:hypothetical protein
MYAFQELLRVSPANVSPPEFSGEAVWVFTCHLASSFSGKKVCSKNLPESKWIETMWSVRQKYGKNYTDKVMGFTLRMWSTSPPGQWSTFDQFFMNKLMSGEVVMNGDPGRFNKVREIAKQHGVQIE